jgi:hypothetical protein
MIRVLRRRLRVARQKALWANPQQRLVRNVHEDIHQDALDKISPFREEISI